MNATGITRSIDNLGRVVIPKELRRALRINEGDALEVYTKNKCVIFKKANEEGGIFEILRDLQNYIGNDGKLCGNVVLGQKIKVNGKKNINAF